jgi:hypothetical protein
MKRARYVERCGSLSRIVVFEEGAEVDDKRALNRKPAMLL